VQVIKEGIAPRVRRCPTYISIAGRYLVLMPGLNRVGMSAKLADDEQRRPLREIFHELQPPKGGVHHPHGRHRPRPRSAAARSCLSVATLAVVVRRIRKLKAPAKSTRKAT